MLKNYFKYIVVFFILYFIWAMVLPLLFSLNADKLVNIVEKTTGTRLELTKPKLNLWVPTNIKFQADKLSVLNNDSSQALFIEKPYVSIKLLPLFLGKLNIRSFEAKDIQSNFYFDNNLYLGDYLIEIPKENNNLKLDRIKINKYQISVFDKKSKIPIIINGQSLYYKQAFGNFYIRGYNKLKINSSTSTANFDIKIPRRNYIQNSKINIVISNFELSPFKNLFNTFLNNNIVALDGLININSNNTNLKGEIDRAKLLMTDSAKSIIFPEKFIINSDFKLNSNNIKIKSFDVKGDGIIASLKGEISNFTSKNPLFNLEINMPEGDARKIALMLPPLVVPQFNIYRLKMYPFYGNAKSKLTIKGKFPEPNINGYINLSDVYLIKRIPNADETNINIKCIDKKMNIDVVVPAGDGETVYITGDIDDYGDNHADLRIRSSKSVNLATAEFVLNPLHQILRFIMGPVPIMDIKGRGNINIRIIGSKKDPHIWGDFNFKDTSASFNDIHNLILEHASGTLSFNDQDAHFINKTGTVHGEPFIIDGKCTLFGNIDFDIIGHNQPSQDLLNTLKTSPLFQTLKTVIPDIQQSKGNVDLVVNLTGKLPNIYDIRLTENLFAKGTITLKNNSLILNKIPIKKVNGIIGFDNLDVDLDLLSILDNSSKIKISGKIKNEIANLDIVSPYLDINEFTKEYFKELDNCYVSLKAKYKGRIDKIELNKLECTGKVLRNDNPIKNIKVLTGELNLKNSRLSVNNLSGFIKQNPFNINLIINNISEDIRKSVTSGNILLKNFDLKTLNYFKNIDYLPKDVQKIISGFEILDGNTDLNLKIRNNNINGSTNFNNINAVYKFEKTPKTELAIPIKLIHGEIVIKNNRIFMNKMNTLVDNMPVLVYGNISNIFRTPKFDIHINSKLMQKTFDKYWNVDNIYPIKLKGDILMGSLITGTPDKINTRLDLKLESNSSVYYMGATVGDPENPITLNSNFDIFKNNVIRLNKFEYGKLITSQNNKQNIFPLLTVTGGITYYDNSFYKFDNLLIKTDSPTDARIFNVIFKKPTIKHGQFVSNLRINGKSTSPHILGNLDITGLDMPFLNTTIKDLSMDFKDKDIILESKGEVLSNNIIFSAKLKNKFTSNYIVEKAEIFVRHIDINSLMSDLKQLELKTFNENSSNNTNTDFINTVLFNKLTVYADSVKIKNLNAKNFKASCTLNEKMQLFVKDFKFDIANGEIHGSALYNLLNNVLKLNLNANNVNANELMIALLDLPNQIYGNLVGTIELISNVTNETTSKETLSGKILFTVQNGRMPKLGSLEYLLKAGNIIKSGITAISMNSIVELITPLKTGEFSSIDGNIKINHGICNVELHSKGKDLNMFIKGKHNLVTNIADMLVLGQLSRKVSTAFGAVGNLSLNTLFNKIPGVNLSENGQLINELNKIPGIEISNKSYRKFVVEIFGNINNDNNVKSFKWIN